MKVFGSVPAKVFGLALTAASMMITSAPAVASGSALEVTQDSKYTDIANFPARITRNIERFEVSLTTPLESGDLSVWYRQSRSCGSFNINKVEYLNEAGEWVGTTANRFDDVSHFRLGGATSKIAVSVSTDVVFGLRCDLVVRKANFIVPDTVELLGRYTSVCEDDACDHQVVRLDSNVQEVLKLSEADVVRFGLQSEAIYKLRGYVDPTSDQTIFVLLSAERILR